VVEISSVKSADWRIHAFTTFLFATFVQEHASWIMKYNILLLSLFVSGLALSQENYVFSPINSTHGLSDNQVRSICQLPDGRMVVITDGLVNVYDGTAFRYIHYNDSKAYTLTNYSGYHRAYVDSESRLWLKTHRKLLLFDFRKELFVPKIDSVFALLDVKEQVADVFMDNQHNLWFLTANKELLFRNTNNNSTTLFLSKVDNYSNPNDVLYELAVSNKQLFLFFRSGLMVCYDMESREELYSETPFKDHSEFTSTLMVVPNNQYLYQVRSGQMKGLLLRFNVLNRKWERILETDYWQNTLTFDENNNCWISSFAGIWLIDENLSNKQFISPLKLVDGRVLNTEISTQYTDKNGGLWLGTVDRGLLYYHPDRFKFNYFGRSLFKNINTQNLKVTCFAEHNNIILAGTNHGVFKYVKGSNSLESIPEIPVTTHCTMMLKDSQKRIWICSTNKGLFCITQHETIHYEQPVGSLYLLETFDGAFYLITHNAFGTFDPQTGNFKPLEFAAGFQNGNSVQLIEYGNDKILGTNNIGIFIYNRVEKTIEWLTQHDVFQHSNQKYHCLFSDSRGLIWFGTQDGLNVYNRQNQTTISLFKENGLANSSIRSVIEDNHGRIWVSTANGISCINVQTIDDDFRFSFLNYNRFDGVIENEFLPRSVVKTTDGRLLWGGIDGFNETDLKRIDRHEPQLYVPLFTRFSLTGNEIRVGENYDGNIILEQPITTTKEIRLKHHQNFFNIEFSALNYINPTQTIYRYQLEGVDAGWREIKTNDGIGRAGYTNLSPGVYRLIVQTANNNLEWNERFAELSIVITPPFWRTGWAYSTYLLLIIVLVYLSLSYTIQHNIQKTQKRQKEELDQLKFKFFTNISHELRTPLTLIITPLDSIVKKMNDETLKSQLTGILSNAHELLNLVNQLLAFRKLEMNGETLNLGYCNLSELIERIVQPFKDLACENELHFEFNRPNSDLYLYADQDKIRKIVNNLLSNAFKFTPKNGQIHLKIEKDETSRQLYIQISDTGCGIGEDEQAQIFDRFYQAKNQRNQTGSGIGLHLVKEYAELHNGSVELESSINEGSIFTVTLSSDLKPQNPKNKHNDKIGKNKTLKILVVDDHSEFRNFLFNELSEKYQVILAADGKEGLQKTRNEQPDLIVSDLMMPEMTGTELCQQLKSDVDISHIPVILLTAKTTDEAQLEGFEAGADAYIAKPFNMEILLLRIENLLEQQIKRKELFRNSIVITPAKLATSNVDEELIRKALNHIETNMDNGSYSVEQLSKDMYMDRTGLYRKLTAITGQTPTEFMRTVRLKKAAQLLQLGHTVSEVADNVGFGSTSYFTKCFQEEFGIKPSQYKN
jgi:signal transduction histidine kinase/DNA-binding response OmpR family regulator/ligand-binding sensor domain-containing protein